MELEGLEKLSVHVYNVIKNNNGGYTATFQMQTTTTGHSWSGTKSQKQIQILDSYDRKTVTNLYTGDLANSNAQKDGFNITEWKGRDVSAGDIWQGAKNNPEFQRAGETLGNVATVASLIVGPELLLERALAQTAVGVNLAKKGTTVLGKFPDYIKLSDKLNARRFNIPTDVWNKMSSAEQWGANVKFLDRTISRGDDIILSNPVKNIKDVTGYFRRELDYLIDKGYKLSDDGAKLLKN